MRERKAPKDGTEPRHSRWVLLGGLGLLLLLLVLVLPLVAPFPLSPVPGTGPAFVGLALLGILSLVGGLSAPYRDYVRSWWGQSPEEKDADLQRRLVKAKSAASAEIARRKARRP